MHKDCGQPVQKPRKSNGQVGLYSTLATPAVVISNCSCEIFHTLVTVYGLFIHIFSHSLLSARTSSGLVFSPVATTPNVNNAIFKRIYL